MKNKNGKQSPLQSAPTDSGLRASGSRLNKGFTLIEMLVVIVVIGILATIVLVSVSSGRKKAMATKAKTDMVELSKAFEMAAGEGCRKISFNTSGELSCTPPGAAAAKIYATLSTAPSGITYSIQFAGGTSTQSGSGWSTAIVDSSVNGGYSFRATGFTNSETFTCNDGSITGQTRSGCYCSTNDACSQTL